MSYLEDARRRFSQDVFATEQTGIVIEDCHPGYARAYFDILPHHKNAAGAVMGGAICTLADFTFAVAANAHPPDALTKPDTVSLSLNCAYLSPARGERLIAEARSIKSGRSTCFYSVEVRDEQDTHVASVTVTGFVKSCGKK